MKNFLDAVKRKKKYFHSFQDELKILKVLDAIEESSRKESFIIVGKLQQNKKLTLILY